MSEGMGKGRVTGILLIDTNVIQEVTCQKKEVICPLFFCVGHMLSYLANACSKQVGQSPTHSPVRLVS